MYIFGHAGLTIAAARAVNRDVDTRWVGLLALAPDFIDKPGSRLWPALAHHNTRNFGHTLLFALLVGAALLSWKRRPKPALLLWGCYVGHFLLDAMWVDDNPAVLFWPLLGHFPPPAHGTVARGLMPWYILGEIAGLIIVINLAQRHRLFERPRLAAFLRSGRLD